ncbi:MAG TPA: HAMP domain-containing sensor histidine kinase [Actinomycetota bacterium]|nr:HAMP domain-containing sensor histidine kinase [Actinomycetota bacterium]
MSVRARIIILGGLCIWVGVLFSAAVVGSLARVNSWLERIREEPAQMEERANVIEWAIQKSKTDPAALPTAFPSDLPAESEEQSRTYARMVLADGTVLAPPGQSLELFEPFTQVQSAEGRTIQLPNLFERIMSEPSKSYPRKEGTEEVQILTRLIQPGVALQVARVGDAGPPNIAGTVLTDAELWARVAVVGGVLAFIAAALVAFIATMPIRKLSRAAERVADTRQVAQGITGEGTGDMRKLTRSFNRIVGALGDSLSSQRQLVTDASHELRTPLTSLRTNIEVLLRVESLAPEDQKKLLRDVVEQIDELTFLISDLTDLARVGDSAPESVDVRLDRIVERTVRRMERNWPKVSFEMAIEPTTVRGVASKIERAVSNILDNAAKWSPDGGTIEVSVSSGELRVRDHGPGISDADLPHIFERFYRADDTRGQPGSGIGLAIVQQVAESHGGSVSAQNAQGGGAIVRMTLPESQLEAV